MYHRILRIVVFIFGFWAQATLSQIDQKETDFIRFFAGQEQWSGKLQTAIVSYQNSFGVTVNLVSAVHLADISYYEQLNDYFKTQDLVLYELVANSDERPGPNSMVSDMSPITLMQRTLGNILEISFQLEQIDYSPENFRHADLNPVELFEIMTEKDQNFFTAFLSLAVSQIAADQSSDETGLPRTSLTIMSLFRALISEDRVASLKYLFAEELGRSGGLSLSPEIENQLTILGDRNLAAIRTLENALEQSADKIITIFFGAAHMPGLERALITDLGFEEEEKRWITAWEVP